MGEMILRPIRYYRRVTAQKRRLREIGYTTAKGAGFVILVASSE